MTKIKKYPPKSNNVTSIQKLWKCPKIFQGIDLFDTAKKYDKKQQ